MKCTWGEQVTTTVAKKKEKLQRETSNNIVDKESTVNPFFDKKFGNLLISTTLPRSICSSSSMWEHASKWYVQKMSFLGPLPQYLPHIFEAHANRSSIVALTHTRNSYSRATIAEETEKYFSWTWQLGYPGLIVRCLCSGSSSAVHLRCQRFLASAFHIFRPDHQYAKVTYTLTFV